MSSQEEAQPVLQQTMVGRVLVLELNRPGRLNALSGELHEALSEALDGAAHNDNVGAVVVTGRGRAFCAGGDLGGGASVSSARTPRSMEQRVDGLLHHGEAVRLLYEMAKPTIAMINGAAAGAGLALALACDLRFIASDAIVTTAYVNVALSGDFGVSYFLTKIVGPAKARELLFLSDRIDAAEAHRIGLVNRVAEPGTLRDQAMAIATGLANGPGVALRYMKQNIRHAETDGFVRVLESEAFAMVRCGRTEDVKEAALARREKRSPVFRNY